MHLVGDNSSMQPTQLWSVGKSTFLHDHHIMMMCIYYKLCFPPMLLVLAMKCCTKMPCPLPHNHYCCFVLTFFTYSLCLPHLLVCTCLISSPIARPPSYVLCWCVLRCMFMFWCWSLFCVCILHFQRLVLPLLLQKKYLKSKVNLKPKLKYTR